jgi:hypothetical protein
VATSEFPFSAKQVNKAGDRLPPRFGADTTGYICSTNHHLLEESEMTDTVPHDKTEDLSDEVRDARDEASRVAERAKNETREGADRVKDDADDVADKVSDAVEDVIPGDSDHDGH